TVVASRGNPRPHRIGIAELRELCDVPLPRRARPLTHCCQPARHLFAQAARDSLLLGQLESMQTQVVRAPLQQRDAHRPADSARDGGQIAMEQLVLKIARARRDDDAPTGEQRRHEIGERLAGAGAGLHDQAAVRAQCKRDLLCHRDLFLARGEAGDRRRQRSFHPEQIYVVVHQWNVARNRASAVAPGASGFRSCQRMSVYWEACASCLEPSTSIISESAGPNVLPPSTEKDTAAPGPAAESGTYVVLAGTGCTTATLRKGTVD